MKKKSLALILSVLLLINIIQIPSHAETNEMAIYNFLTTSMELNSAAACGVLANIQCESSFVADIMEHGYTWAEGAGYGICQWTNYPRTAKTGRRTNLVNYCTQNGFDYKTLTGQLWFLKYELETTQKITLNKIEDVPNTAQGAYTAGHDWCYYFEIPANYATVSVTRGNLAKNTYWPKYLAIENAATATPDPNNTPAPTLTPVSVSSVSLAKKSVYVSIGTAFQLTHQVNPSNASIKDVVWTSSDDRIVSVTTAGKATAHTTGTAQIIVTTYDGWKHAFCKVTVIRPVTGVTLDKSTLTVRKGKTARLTPTVTPSNASNKKTLWMSANLKVATVNSKGVVKGLKKGSAHIYVVTFNGKKNAGCKVYVK